MKTLFFDGYCTLCNSLIDWLIRHDKKNVLTFSSLQGETAKMALPSAFRSSGDDVDTVIYLRDGKIYERSTAILKVLQDLGAPWSVAAVFWVVPRPLRDIVYRLVARSRYRVFGKRETCRVPTARERAKILP